MCNENESTNIACPICTSNTGAPNRHCLPSSYAQVLKRQNLTNPKNKQKRSRQTHPDRQNEKTRQQRTGNTCFRFLFFGFRFVFAFIACLSFRTRAVSRISMIFSRACVVRTLDFFSCSFLPSSPARSHSQLRNREPKKSRNQEFQQSRNPENNKNMQ